MIVKQHKASGLWCREDGAICMPPCPKYPKFRWTYGSRDKCSGYLKVKFRGKSYLVHRLVAGAFLKNPNGYPTVDHYPDRNPLNNRADNLRYASPKMQSDNQQRVDDSIERYGVRYCDNPAEYQRALRANSPELVERERAYRREYYAKNAEQVRAKDRERKRERYANDPEFAEKKRARDRAYYEKRKARYKKD